MSTYVSKVAYRIRLGMDSKAALSFFRAHIGEPTEVWDEGDGDYHFWYGNGSLHYKKENPTDFKEFVGPCSDIKTGEWGLEVIIAEMDFERMYCNGVCPDVLHGAPIDLEAVHEGLLGMGLSPEMVARGKVHTYTYYNGSDEPVQVR